MATIREFITEWGFKVKDRGLKDMDTNLRKAAGSADQLRQNFKRMAVAVAGTVAAIKTFELGRGIINIADDAEKADIAFTTMLGSAEKAQKVITDLNTFAAKTPFTLRGIRQNAQQLLGMGIESDRLLPTLKALGDISAGLNVPLERLALNFGQVRTRGKLTGQELRDFAVAGVPIISQLATQLGVAESAIADMVSRGEIDFAMVEKAFIDMTSAGGRFNDLMIKQAKTFGGIVSNIGDFFEILAIDIGKQLLPAAKALALEFLAFVDANRELIKTGVADFFKAVFETARDVWQIMKLIFEVVTDVVNEFGGFGEVFKFLLNLFLTFTGLKILKFLGPLFKFFKDLKKGKQAVLAFGGGFTVLLGKLKPVIKFLKLFGLIFLTLLELPFLLVEDFAVMLEGGDSVLGQLGDMFIATFDWIDNAIFTFIQGIIDAFMGLVRFFRELAAFFFRVFTLPFAKIIGFINSILSRIPKSILAKVGAEDLSKSLTGAQNFLETTAVEGIAGGKVPFSGAGVGATNTNEENVTINVNGGNGSPEQIARAVGDELERRKTSQNTRKRNVQ